MLSDKEALIINAVEHQAEASIVEVAKKTKLKAHTVRYHLGNLKSRGIISDRVPFINPYPLGYSDYTLYFSLNAASQSQHADPIAFLCTLNGVSWVASLGGAYQGGIAICAKRPEAAARLIDSMSEKFGDIFFQKSISVRLQFCAFGRKYLGSSQNKPKVLRVSMAESKECKIDALDHTILSVISNKSFNSKRELARSLGQPFSTVERRINRLEQAGVIAGYIYRLKLFSANILSYRLLINARGRNKELSNSLFEFSRKHPRVLRFIECMGSWDYEIGIEVEHPQAVNTFIARLCSDYGPQLNSIESLQIFEHLKYSAYPF